MSTNSGRPYLNRWVAVVIVILLVVSVISDLGGAWQSFQSLVKWAAENLPRRGQVFVEENKTFVTVSAFALVVVVISILIALLQRIVNAAPAAGAAAGGARGAAGRRGRHERSTRQRYLDYLEEDVRNRRKASIHFARFIDIGLSESLNATMPLNFVTYDYYIFPEAQMKEYGSFEEAFEDCKRRILLLGHPGSGKTTTLLNLALALIEEAKADPSAPAPLLLNLSEFGETREKGLLSRLSGFSRTGGGDGQEARAFETWLVRMLNKMPVEGLKQVSRQWVEGGQVALLLDGLDEVGDTHVKELVRLMNETYLCEHPQQTVVVCSRIIDYQPLMENKQTRLALEGAATLKPLDREQINSYLEAAEATALRDALFDHEDLYEMAESPLTLSMMTLAYGGKAPLDIPRNQPFLERRRWLLDTYVSRMVQRNARRLANVPFDLNPDNDAPTPYSLDKINHHLGWLAIKLSERMRTLLPLGRLHSVLSDAPQGTKPRVLTSPNVSTMIVGALVSLLTVGALLYLPGGVAGPAQLLALCLLAPAFFCAGAALDDDEFPHTGSKAVDVPLGVLVFGGIVAFLVLCFGLLNSSFLQVLPGASNPAVGMAILAPLVLVAAALTDTSDLNELKKELRDLGALMLPCLLGALSAFALTRETDSIHLGLAVGGLFFLFVFARGENAGTRFSVFLLHFVWITAAALGLGWGVTWVVGEPGALTMSLAVPAAVGFILSGKNTGGTAVGFAVALVTGSLLGGIEVGVLASVGFIILFPKVLREESHRLAEKFLLNPALELVLLARRDICFRYRSFLRYAAETLLLKRSGADYEFVHRLLRDHFAIRELIPALFGASGDEQLRIINQLSRQGDSGFDALSGLITYPDSRVRVAAVEGLGRIAIPKVLTVIRRILQEDADAEVRAAALRSLEKFPADGTYFELVRLGFSDSAPRVRGAALFALKSERLDPSDRDYQKIWEERGKRWDELRKLVREGLDDQSDEVFQAALVATSRFYLFYDLGDSLRSQKERVLSALRAPAPHVRSAAAHIIGKTKHRDAVQDLIAALRDPDGQVRVSAAEALASLGSPDAIPALLAVADDADSKVRTASVAAIGGIAAELHSPDKEQAVKEALLKALSDKDEKVRYAAASALGNFTGSDVVARLGRALRDRVGSVQLGALRSLQKLKDTSAAPHLMRALKDNTLRVQAAEALAEIRDPSVSRTLKSWLGRGGDNTRAGAIITLTLSGAAEITPTLRELLDQPPNRYAKAIRKFFTPDAVNVQPYAAVALGRLGGLDSLDSLLNLTQHETPATLMARAVALTHLPHDVVEAKLAERVPKATGKQASELSAVAHYYSGLRGSRPKPDFPDLFSHDVSFFHPSIAMRNSDSAW